MYTTIPMEIMMKRLQIIGGKLYYRDGVYHKPHKITSMKYDVCIERDIHVVLLDFVVEDNHCYRIRIEVKTGILWDTLYSHFYDAIRIAIVEFDILKIDDCKFKSYLKKAIGGIL